MAPAYNFKADEIEHFVFLPSKKIPPKMNYFPGSWPNFVRNKTWLSSGTLATSLRSDSRDRPCLPSSHTLPACKHCSSLRGRGRSENRAFYPSALFLHHWLPASWTLEGWQFGTNSLCQSPPSQEINAQSHWGKRHRSTNTGSRGSSCKRFHRQPQWESLPAFPGQHTCHA